MFLQKCCFQQLEFNRIVLIRHCAFSISVCLVSSRSCYELIWLHSPVVDLHVKEYTIYLWFGGCTSCIYFNISCWWVCVFNPFFFFFWTSIPPGNDFSLCSLNISFQDWAFVLSSHVFHDSISVFDHELGYAVWILIFFWLITLINSICKSASNFILHIWNLSSMLCEMFAVYLLLIRKRLIRAPKSCLLFPLFFIRNI